MTFRGDRDGSGEESRDKRGLLQAAGNGIVPMSEDEANRMIYEARLKAQRDEYSRLRGARQEMAIEIARNMLTS
jgi:hypothetical protein